MTTSEAQLQDIVAAKVTDARGVGCPGPLLEAKKAMPGVPVGAIVEVWSTDPVTKTDIAAWSAKVGHEFLGVVAADGYDRVFVRRAK